MESLQDHLGVEVSREVSDGTRWTDQPPPDPRWKPRVEKGDGGPLEGRTGRGFSGRGPTPLP